jgi:hypothetical protein
MDLLEVISNRLCIYLSALQFIDKLIINFFTPYSIGSFVSRSSILMKTTNGNFITNIEFVCVLTRLYYTFNYYMWYLVDCVSSSWILNFSINQSPISLVLSYSFIDMPIPDHRFLMKRDLISRSQIWSLHVY